MLAQGMMLVHLPPRGRVEPERCLVQVVRREDPRSLSPLPRQATLSKTWRASQPAPRGLRLASGSWYRAQRTARRLRPVTHCDAAPPTSLGQLRDVMGRAWAKRTGAAHESMSAEWLCQCRRDCAAISMRLKSMVPPASWPPGLHRQPCSSRGHAGELRSGGRPEQAAFLRRRHHPPSCRLAGLPDAHSEPTRGVKVRARGTDIIPDVGPPRAIPRVGRRPREPTPRHIVSKVSLLRADPSRSAAR